MSHWPFVAAAYVLALGAVALLLVQSFLAMRGAESEADRLRDRR